MTELVVGDLTLTVERSARRKTVGLTVERDGSLVVRAPQDADTDELAKLVRSREVWIYGKLAEKEALLRAWRPKEYVPGEGFLYLGRRYRLRLIDPTDKSAPSLQLADSWFELRRDRQFAAKEFFESWYRARGQEWLAQRVRRFLDRLGIEPAPINVQDLGFRWGSCGVRSLNFHWRTMTLPPRIIDYVIVHELAHILEPHHDDAFWERVARVLPDYEERRSWLAMHGADA
jgi:predicted metal-dependent hydrolase